MYNNNAQTVYISKYIKFISNFIIHHNNYDKSKYAIRKSLNQTLPVARGYNHMKIIFSYIMAEHFVHRVRATYQIDETEEFCKTYVLSRKRNMLLIMICNIRK